MQQKSDRLHLRVKPEVKERLQEEADELGCSLSDLVRMRLQVNLPGATFSVPQGDLEKAIARAITEALGGI